MQKKKPFKSRAEIYRSSPTLRNRSLLAAQELERVKENPDFAEFKPIIHRAITDIRAAGRLDAEERRQLVVKALKNFVCELDELTEETRLKRAEIVAILDQLVAEKLVIVKWRQHYLNPDGTHGSNVYFWHDSESLIKH